MKKLIALTIAATLTSATAQAAELSPLNLKYRATVAGLPLGKLKLHIDRTDDQYTAAVSFKLVTLLRAILDGDAQANAAGQLQQGKPTPQEFQFKIDGRKKNQHTAIAFDADGNPSEIKADPPLRETAYRIGVEQAGGTIDPASAAVLLASPRTDACDLSMDVFDGAKRHRISLTGVAEQPDSRGVITCTGLYERIAGFKAKYMTPDARTYPFSAQLVEDIDGGWLPVKIWADTKFGPASATFYR